MAHDSALHADFEQVSTVTPMLTGVASKAHFSGPHRPPSVVVNAHFSPPHVPAVHFSAEHLSVEHFAVEQTPGFVAAIRFIPIGV